MAKYKKKLDDDIRCPLEYGLMLFGGKWKSRIICVLSANERLRYSEIRREMYNITDAVLAATLKDLIEAGIIDRKSYDEIPPRVEYSLTEKGRSVVPILQSICQWSDIFYQEDTENEIKALTDKIRLLSMVEQISYLTLSFGVMFACMLLFVTGIIAVGVLAASLCAK